MQVAVLETICNSSFVRYKAETPGNKSWPKVSGQRAIQRCIRTSDSPSPNHMAKSGFNPYSWARPYLQGMDVSAVQWPSHSLARWDRSPQCFHYGQQWWHSLPCSFWSPEAWCRVQPENSTMLDQGGRCFWKVIQKEAQESSSVHSHLGWAYAPCPGVFGGCFMTPWWVPSCSMSGPEGVNLHFCRFLTLILVKNEALGWGWLTSEVSARKWEIQNWSDVIQKFT